MLSFILFLLRFGESKRAGRAEEVLRKEYQAQKALWVIVVLVIEMIEKGNCIFLLRESLLLWAFLHNHHNDSFLFYL